MAFYVIVTNCSDAIDYKSMGRMFSGYCQTGAWGCFDEFNRIPIEVLSVVSSQVNAILNAIREKRSEFDFMGEIIHLEPTVGMFITMNPGYAGRRLEEKKNKKESINWSKIRMENLIC